MARSDLDSASASAINSYLPLYPVWLVRLDIQGDPVYVHTGIGDLFFPTGTFGDSALENLTFIGIRNIGEISAIQDGSDGSQSVNLTLPGVTLQNDYLNQIIYKGDVWQGYEGYIWLATANNLGQVTNRPMRVKTGRMDQMPIAIDPDNGTGTITVTLESQASYSGIASFTRYSEQKEVDPSDTSQDYVTDLSNKTPEIGNTASDATGSAGVAATGGAAIGKSQDFSVGFNVN